MFTAPAMLSSPDGGTCELLVPAAAASTVSSKCGAIIGDASTGAIASCNNNDGSIKIVSNRVII
jgi:hypothetical protein